MKVWLFLSNIPFLTPPLRVVRGVSVATVWVSEFFFLALGFGDSTDPVILSAYSILGDSLGEVCDRSKDKPVLIIVIVTTGSE